VNTAQLILLWYGGLAVATIFLFLALDGQSAWFLIATIATVTGIAIVTFATGTRGHRRWVAVWVAGPLLVLAATGVGLAKIQEVRERRALYQIGTDQIELKNVEFKTNTIGGLQFQGRVRNKSSFVLTQVRLEFIAQEGRDVIDRGVTVISIRVPPEEIRDFADGYVPLTQGTVAKLVSDDKRNRSVTFEYRPVGTRGEPR
jgi:hypothetical protein